ncbi:hypothetical protein J2T14_002771 [Paenibacillus harenae]|nr:hypothetical protein [Paenibacillus harenae]
MNRIDERFYCVTCGELVPSPEANVQFRTGFFRIVHPMCFCTACSRKEEKTADTINAKFDHYDYKMLLRSDAKVAEHSDHLY